jgi:hypothetical protein
MTLLPLSEIPPCTVTRRSNKRSISSATIAATGREQVGITSIELLMTKLRNWRRQVSDRISDQILGRSTAVFPESSPRVRERQEEWLADPQVLGTEGMLSQSCQCDAIPSVRSRTDILYRWVPVPLLGAGPMYGVTEGLDFKATKLAAATELSAGDWRPVTWNSVNCLYLH